MIHYHNQALPKITQQAIKTRYQNQITALKTINSLRQTVGCRHKISLWIPRQYISHRRFLGKAVYSFEEFIENILKSVIFCYLGFVSCYSFHVLFLLKIVLKYICYFFLILSPPPNWYPGRSPDTVVHYCFELR